MTGIELITHVVPWFLTVCALSFTLYNIIHNNKKEEKKTAVDYATAITTFNIKLDNLQTSANNTNGVVNGLNNKLDGLDNKVEGIDKRLTVVETKLDI